VTPAKAKKPSKKDSEVHSWSLSKTCIALAFAWAAIVWGLAANAYHVFEARAAGVPVTSGRTSLWSLIGVFLSQAIGQLSNAGQVISHTITNVIWIPGVLVVGEVGVLVLWLVMSRLERQLAADDRRRNRY
jgi:hypothetical protein